MNRWRTKRSQENEQVNKTSEREHLFSESKIQEELTEALSYNLEILKNKIGHNCDVKFREIKVSKYEFRIAIIYVEGIADTALVHDYLYNGLLIDLQSNEIVDQNDYFKDYIKNQTASACTYQEANNFKDLISCLFFGSVAVLADGLATCYLLGEAKTKTRNVDEPLSEALVRGPRVGFIENLEDNTALLRRFGKEQNLSIESSFVGISSKKKLIIAYMTDIADPTIVEEVKVRIKKIKIDSIPDSGYIEQLIEDNYLSPFPQIQSTERPDRVMSALMEGRVAILLDGSPFALIVPVTFQMLLQSPEDYYERWIAATLIRMLRYVASFISLFAPSLYIAFVSFHQGLIPTKLVFHIASTRGGVPFPPLIEALIMEVAIEVLREAGLRLPKPIGQSLGIVGGLIIGQAAVEAGLISPVMVIVVAVTAISSFTLPQYNVGIALRMLRFISMLFASTFGLYGVILFFLLIGSHLVRLKSFGTPYLSPAVPIHLNDWKDFMIRAPIFLMKRRPKMLNPKDSIRKK